MSNTDKNKAMAAKQLGLARAAQGKHGLIAAARREAFTLAQHGPITIDDVSTALERIGVDDTAPGVSPRMWKGVVFRDRRWRKIGSIPSRFEHNNMRHVNVWALKTWLAENVLNGTDWDVSAFRILKIFSVFQRKNPLLKDHMDRCNWIIGTDELNDDILWEIKQAGNRLYGIPVTFVAGGIGAAIAPPLALHARMAHMEHKESVATGAPFGRA